MARASQLSGSQAINEYPLRRRHPILMQSRGIDEDSLLVAEGREWKWNLVQRGIA